VLLERPARGEGSRGGLVLALNAVVPRLFGEVHPALPVAHPRVVDGASGCLLVVERFV